MLLLTDIELDSFYNTILDVFSCGPATLHLAVLVGRSSLSARNIFEFQAFFALLNIDSELTEFVHCIAYNFLGPLCV